MTNIEPGWYRDPAAPDTQRFWDGEQWIGKPVDVSATPPDTPEPLPEPEPEPPAEPATVGQPTTVRNNAASTRAGRPGAANMGSLGPPDPKRVAELMAGRQLANPGLRLGARLIDIAAVAVLNLIVNGWFIYQYLSEIMPTFRTAISDPSVNPMEVEFSDRANSLQILILIIAVLLWFAYEVPSTVKSGQTLGKRLMGIQVASIPGVKLRYGMATSRWSLMMLPLVCFPFGMILAVVDGLWCLHDKPFKQCLHDKSVMTMVVMKTEGDRKDVPPDPR